MYNFILADITFGINFYGFNSVNGASYLKRMLFIN